MRARRERGDRSGNPMGLFGYGNASAGGSYPDVDWLILSGSDYYLPLTHTAIPTRGSLTPSFTRATTKTIPDNEGVLRTLIAGELGFPGARRVRNFSLAKTEDLTAAGGWGLSNITTPGLANVAAPDATTTGWLLTATSSSAQWYRPCTGMTPNGSGIEHIWLRRNTGSGAVQLFNAAGAAAGDLGVTTTWAQYSLPVTITAGGTAYLGIQINVSGDKIEVWHPQLEEVTGQSVQTAGEYVSVGALDYRSTQNPLYLSLPGTAGHYASTPDSVANSITGDIDIRVKVSMADWTPAANQTLVSKLSAANVQMAYALTIDITTGCPRIYGSLDGSTFNIAAVSTAAPTFADGTIGWIRCTRASSSGVVNFFTSLDGTTWTQLGTANLAGAAGALFDSTSILKIGQLYDAGTSPLNGNIYEAQIYSTIGGTTPVVDFNPHRDAVTPTGTITSSTTSEVWTLNGASSVVRSAAYHGSMVDGVKTFPTSLAGAALPTRATYDAVSLPGVAGSYVSTPDSVANSITGDIDIRVKVALPNWGTLAAEIALYSKYTGTGNNRSIILAIQTTGVPKLYYSLNGVAANTNVASAATGFAANTTNWVRVTRTAGGAGEVNFYTSADGTTWTPLGVNPVVGTAGNLYDGTSVVELGATLVGTTFPLSGKIYQAQIYNGINGTLAVDFDASRYEGGTTLTGSTGETWTLNGTATIHKTNNPMTTPMIELAATNLCLQSNALTTTWSATGTPAATQNVVGPDGATSAWTLTDNDGAALEAVRQVIAHTAATHTISVFVKKTTGAQASYPMIRIDDAISVSANCTIDTSNGVATVWTGYTGNTIATSSATCVSYNTDYWRVSLTYLATAVNWTLFLLPAGTTNATQSTGVIDNAAQGSAVFYGAQVELGTAATTYIPTTTAEAPRYADQLYYTGADVANIKSLAAIGFKREVGFAAAGIIVALSDATTTNYADFGLTDADSIQFEGKATAQQWSQTASLYIPGSTENLAWSMATNDIKSCFGDGEQIPDTAATVPAITRIEYGMLAGATQPNGYPGSLYGWTRNLSQSEINATVRPIPWPIPAAVAGNETVPVNGATSSGAVVITGSIVVGYEWSLT